ncbi:hypothetical protein [Paracoccus sp. 228]|uniref:hypothetical protein n=1 Tax=Paracoccus sp. 228 TaxID=1192054 RepID=UPI0005E65638|nr:hypothetical protein [Paracoccus sp. 228]KIX16165.1 hypothetical protein SY26_19435 [Paracoccus sp. 228]
MPDPREVDFTQSHWLRKAKAELLLRDPVDAVNDVEALLKFVEANLRQILSEHSQTAASSEQ